MHGRETFHAANPADRALGSTHLPGLIDQLATWADKIDYAFGVHQKPLAQRSENCTSGITPRRHLSPATAKTIRLPLGFRSAKATLGGS
jgi:hypothetical protein